MFGIGLPELIIIMVIALIVIGPNKLPELAKAIGKGMAEFRKATREIKESLDPNGEIESARDDLVDSISGLDRSFDLDDVLEEEENTEPELDQADSSTTISEPEKENPKDD